MKAFEINKILIPIDFSKSSLNAINPAVELAKSTNAEITLVHVLEVLQPTAPPFHYIFPISPAYENDITDISNKHLNKLGEAIKKKGVRKVNIVSIPGRTHKEIVRLSKEIKADIIIMGTHGISGFSEFFIGSNAFRVVSSAECPVLSVQQQSKVKAFKNILIPFRDKPRSREKINYAIKMAEIYGATLHVLGVDTDGGKTHFKKMTLEGQQIKGIVESFGVKCNLKLITEPFLGDTVLKYAKEIKADLIIITSDLDKVSISEYFMGPFAQQIVNHSHVPVLSIRPVFNTDTIDLRFY